MSEKTDREEYTVEDILRKVEEGKTMQDSEEKRMYMKALGSLLLARTGQDRLRKGIFIERNQLELPGLFDHVFHAIGFHHWLDFDDSSVFDGTCRICLICGLVQSSMMSREYAYFEGGQKDEKLRDEIIAHIRFKRGG